MIVDKDGQVRYQALVCGMPGAGKSVLMRAIAKRAIVEDRATVIAHDPEGEWARRWPSSTHAIAGAAVVRSARAAHDVIAVAIRTGRLPAAISVQSSSSDAAELAAELGARLNKPERLTRPLLLCFDEGAYLDTASATHQGDEDRKLTAIRRHRGLAVAWNVQSPATLPEPYWRLATDVYCYQVPGFDDVRTLERRIGMDRGALEYVRHLERYRVVRLQRGRGAVPLWGQA